jgi:hypothetical protein
VNNDPQPQLRYFCITHGFTVTCFGSTGIRHQANRTLKKLLCKLHNIIGVASGGGGTRGYKCPPPNIFSIWVTELKNGKYKIDKKNIKNLRFMGPIFPSLKFDSFEK